VTYNKSGTNPQGKVTVLIKTLDNWQTGQKDGNTHVYLVTSNSIATLVFPTVGTASFTSKSTVKELGPDGTAIATVDSGNMLQMDLNSTTSPQQAGITVQRSTGGLWYSSAWASSGNKVTTVAKPVLGGTVLIQ